MKITRDVLKNLIIETLYHEGEKEDIAQREEDEGFLQAVEEILSNAKAAKNSDDVEKIHNEILGLSNADEKYISEHYRLAILEAYRVIQAFLKTLKTVPFSHEGMEDVIDALENIKNAKGKT